MKKILFLIFIFLFCKENEIPIQRISEKEILQKNFLDLKTANKKLILVFGANWCVDCREFDKYFNEKENLEILNKNFILQKVDIGNFEKNLDLAKEFGKNLEETGIPNVIVFNSNKQILNPNKTEKIYSAKLITSQLVKEFLLRYK